MSKTVYTLLYQSGQTQAKWILLHTHGGLLLVKKSAADIQTFHFDFTTIFFCISKTLIQIFFKRGHIVPESFHLQPSLVLSIDPSLLSIPLLGE